MILFIDLETSGLSPVFNEILEVAIIRYAGGDELFQPICHFYIDHPRITYDLQALMKFGDRIKDRRSGVSVVEPKTAAYLVGQALRDKPTLAGKNIGGFDLPFLLKLAPGLDVRHRHIDLGNKYHDPLDAVLPSLEECRQRALLSSVRGKILNRPVTHTALEDAVLCAELYRGWEEGKLDGYPWRTNGRPC